MRRLATLCIVLLGATGAAPAATVVPMKECVNCTPAQMQDMAKNRPLGMAFIYDLAHNVIKKYEVYMDSTCAPSHPPVESSNSQSPNCGSFRAADEMFPVDANVQTIFNNRHGIFLVSPDIALHASANYSGPMPPDSLTGRPFDLRQVAWDYPAGSYLRFRNYLQNQVSSQNSANDLIDHLGDMIEQVDKPDSTPQPVKDPNGVTSNVTIQSDPSVSPIQVKFCSAVNDCAMFDLPVNNGLVGSLQYNGVLDAEQMMYPSGNNQPPGGGPSWNWRSRGDVDHFRDGLTGIGWDIPGAPTCGTSHWILTIARVNGVFDSATWTCGPP